MEVCKSGKLAITREKVMLFSRIKSGGAQPKKQSMSSLIIWALENMMESLEGTNMPRIPFCGGYTQSGENFRIENPQLKYRYPYKFHCRSSFSLALEVHS